MLTAKPGQSLPVSLAGSTGWCASITWLNYWVPRSHPLPESWPLPFRVSLALSVLSHFSMQIQQKMDVKKGSCFLSMLTGLNAMLVKCSSQCSRKGESKGWAGPSAGSDCCGNPTSEHAGLDDMKNTGMKMFSLPQWLWRFSFQSLKLWKICTFIFLSVPICSQAV